MGHHDELHLGIQLESLLQRLGAHVPGIGLRVDEHRLPVLVGHGIDGSVEGHVGAEHPMAPQSALVGLGLAIELLPRQLGGKVQGRGAAGQAYSILHAHKGFHLLLHLVDVGAYGGDPVGFDGFIHPFLLLPMHGGRGQPDLLFKRFDPDKAWVLEKLVHAVPRVAQLKWKKIIV